LRGREAEGDIAVWVGAHGLIADELLALVLARRVGEELDHEGVCGAAVELGLDGGRAAHGLGGGYDRLVLQIVGALIGVLGVVGGGARSFLGPASQVYAESTVGEDGVALSAASIVVDRGGHIGRRTELRLGLWSKVYLTRPAYSGAYSPKCLEGHSVLKNSFVPFSELCSGA
jgi:hypothetical protein